MNQFRSSSSASHNSYSFPFFLCLFLSFSLYQASEKEELIDCRKDWYQTQTNVILSIFAKDKLDTQVTFETRSVSIDIKIKNNKRYKKTFALFHVSALFENCVQRKKTKKKKGHVMLTTAC